MTEKTQQPKNPPLRFKQSDGTDYPDWRSVRLGDVFTRITDKNIEDNQNCLTISAQHGLVNQLEFFNKKVSAKNLKGYYLLNKGDFAYNKSYSKGYPMGAIKRLKFYEKGVVSTLYICFSIKPEYNGSYFEFFFDGGGVNTGIEQIAQEGARNHGLLNVKINDFFEEIYFDVPNIDEQQKIAEFLSAVDKRIALLQAKYDHLQKYKTGILQKIFTQQIRFKQPNGTDYPDWQPMLLNEVFELKRGLVLASKNISPEYSKNTPYRVFSSQTKNNGVMGYYSEYLFENAITWTTDGNAGDCKYRKGKFYPTNVCGVAIPKEKYAGYTNTCIAEMINQVSRNYVAYAGIPKLMNNVFGTIKIDFPELDEQKRIADFLSAIDKKITKTQKQLTATKSFKSGLLQKMFI